MGGRAIAAPPPIPGSSQMKMQFVPASHGQNTQKNTLGTDVPRIIRHDGAKNRAGRVPGTRTGAADLDYEGNVYTEKRVMWETLSPVTIFSKLTANSFTSQGHLIAKKNLRQRKYHNLCRVFFFLGKDDSFYSNLWRITRFMEKISLPAN